MSSKSKRKNRQRSRSTAEAPDLREGAVATARAHDRPPKTESLLPQRRWVERAEFCAAALLGLVVTALQVRVVSNAGALWRDEANSVHLATVPTFADILRLIEFDSFPLLHIALLRGWIAIFGDGDVGLRALGLLLGVAMLVALFLYVRVTGARFPLLSLALLGLNPIFLRYADSSRAFGLGITLIVLTAASFWWLVNGPARPSAIRIAAATATALLSVHCLYYNSVLLFGVACGALVVALRARAWQMAVIVFGIGLVAAASLLIYVPPVSRMQEWAFILRYPADLLWLWNRAGELMSSPWPAMTWIWCGLFLLGVAVSASALFRRPAPPVALFAGTALVVGTIGYAAFLNVLNYYTRPWYYIALAAFAAANLDVIFGACPGAGAFLLRAGRLVIALALLAINVVPAWAEASTRLTNVNFVAEALAKITTPGDVILVPRWECAVSLTRYYRGPAEIVTLPELSDHRLHRYDLLFAELKTLGSYLPTLARLEEALRAGKRVYCAGALRSPKTAVPPRLAPLHQDATGTWRGSGSPEWEANVGHFLHTNAMRLDSIPVATPEGQKVQKIENLPLSVFEGWR